MRALLLAFCVALAGCAGSPADKAHDTLSAVTEVSDPLYGGAVRGCHALEMEVVNREGTTPAADAESLREIREACDAVFAQFERLIRLQVAARVAIDKFEAGESTREDVDAAVGAVVALWAEVRGLLVELEVL